MFEVFSLRSNKYLLRTEFASDFGTISLVSTICSQIRDIFGGSYKIVCAPDLTSFELIYLHQSLIGYETKYSRLR